MKSGRRRRAKTSLNKANGNMYPWVSHTWNPIKGLCPHECEYCYGKDIITKFNQKQDLRLSEECLNDKLGHDKKIFVGSMNDIFAEDIPELWIKRIIGHCNKYPSNIFIFQSKNPKRMNCFRNVFPTLSLLATTLETNRDCVNSKAPKPEERAKHFSTVLIPNWYKFVSIEPIYDFDLTKFLRMIENIHPQFVSIGADSKKHDLPEPTEEKIIAFYTLLRNITEVKLKPNLKRLAPSLFDNGVD